MPVAGTRPNEILSDVAEQLFKHSHLNVHPRFWGYIVGCGTRIGALADFLAASINPNVGAYQISSMATEIERQTVQWIAEMIGYPTGSAGILTSGGNMANFVGFLAGRRAKANWSIREEGLRSEQSRQLRVYVSEETHTWIEKAGDLFGLGTQSIRWIPVDASRRMKLDALRQRIEEDRAAGDLPLLVVGSGGSVGTGVVDPLAGIASVCREHDLWFHVDGAYGGVAAVLPELGDLFAGLAEADSIALDPHKWLYAPLEAGCTLVRDPDALRNAFSFHPDYYRFSGDPEDEPLNFHEYGLQNSRGFRALKVWLALRQAGRDGYRQMISDDISLSRMLYQLARDHPDLEAFTNNLSITTFRYRPHDLSEENDETARYLNDLNAALLRAMQDGGEAFMSNAVINGTFLLRACIVNFRTSKDDIEAMPELVCRLGSELDSKMRTTTGIG